MLVGFAGYARAGKNTIANMISTEPESGIKMMQSAFADKLKDEVGTMLEAVGINRNVLMVEKESYRDLMVFWGKNRRKQHRDYWVKPVINQYQEASSVEGKDILFMVTDVRYMNEVEAILKEGGKVYIVQREFGRPANDEEAASLKEVYEFSKSHPDKVKLLPVCYTLADLQEQAMDVLDESYQKMRMGGRMC